MLSASEAKDLTSVSLGTIIEDWCNKTLDKSVREAAKAGRNELGIPLYDLPQNTSWEDLADYLRPLGYNAAFKNGYDHGQFDMEPDKVIISWN